MIDSEDARTVYNSRASIYERAMHSFRYASSLKEAVLSLPLQLPAGAAILELGCGTGITLEALLRKFSEARITGVDYSEEMLALCKQKFPSVSLLHGSFNDDGFFLTFPKKFPVQIASGSYDLIFSSGAISEYGDLSKVLPLSYRLLKEDGLLVNIGIKRNPVGLIMGKVWHFRAPGKERFMAACSEAGFSKVEDIKLSWKYFPTSFVKYCVLAKK